MKKHCCAIMKSQMTYKCSVHKRRCPDVVISKGRKDFLLHSPNASYVAKFCPWCGTSLKKSRSKASKIV